MVMSTGAVRSNDDLQAKNWKPPTERACEAIRRNAQSASNLRTAIEQLVTHATSPAEQLAAANRFSALCRKTIDSSSMILGLWQGWQPTAIDHSSPIGMRKASAGSYPTSDTLVIVTDQNLILGRGHRYGVYPLESATAAISREHPNFGPCGPEDGLGWCLTTTAGTIFWRSHPWLGPARMHQVHFSLPHLSRISSAGILAANDKKPIIRRRQAGSPPPGRLIRSAFDAELVACEWVTYMGFGPAHVTPVGPDQGIDVVASTAVAQVKMEAVATGRPVVQQLFGCAVAEGKTGILFSLAGYTREAIAWADRVGLPLFRFDLQGLPSPVNGSARELANV